jgi:outer membrane protein assembly factor BamB
MRCVEAPGPWPPSSTRTLRAHKAHKAHTSTHGPPMIANGKVYVGTTNSVAVFGLLHQEATHCCQLLTRRNGK